MVNGDCGANTGDFGGSGVGNVKTSAGISSSPLLQAVQVWFQFI
jgi:hypothetical protein